MYIKMKKNVSLFSAFILALIISACNLTDKQAQENLKLIEKYQQAITSHDVEVIKDILADNYVGYGPSIGDSMKKDDAILNWDYNMQHLYERLEFKQIENIAISNDNGKTKGTWVSSWGKMNLKFKDLSNESIIWSNTIYKIEDGKIIKSIVFYNEADALRQAGFSYTFREPKRAVNQEK